MPHVLLLPVGSHGDVHPFVGLGHALKARGHRVTLVTNPHFAPLAAGFDGFRPVGTAADYERLAADPDLWHPSRSLHVLFGGEDFPRQLRQTFELLRDHAREPGTVVVAGTLGLAARLANEAFGVPFATVHLQPLTMQSAADAPVYPQWPGRPRLPAWVIRGAYRWADWWVLDPLLAPPLNALRREVGLPPVRRVWGVWKNSPQRVLGLFPDWFGSAPDFPPQTRLTGFVRYDQGERELPPAVERFLNDGPPPVVVSFGSAMRTGRAYFEAAVEACRRLGVRGLLLAKGIDQIPPLPDGMLHADYAPFSRVFPRAAAAVHHGGIGTTAQALAAGVPQLVMPLAHDQYDNADRVRRLGVAQVLPAPTFTADRAERALRELLADGTVPTACAAVKAKMAAGPDPAGEACRWIEELASLSGRSG